MNDVTGKLYDWGILMREEVVVHQSSFDLVETLSNYEPKMAFSIWRQEVHKFKFVAMTSMGTFIFKRNWFSLTKPKDGIKVMALLVPETTDTTKVILYTRIRPELIALLVLWPLMALIIGLSPLLPVYLLALPPMSLFMLAGLFRMQEKWLMQKVKRYLARLKPENHVMPKAPGYRR